MAHVKLDLKNLTDSELGDLAQSIATKLSGNANVPTPNPPLIVLAAGRGAYDTALAAKIAAEATAMQATAAKDAARAALEELLTTEAATVEVATGGDPVKILSTGMGVQSAPTHITEMDPVTEFAVTMGDELGSLDWQCQRVPRARFYNVRLSVGTAAGPWAMVAGSSRSKGELNGLAPNSTVWVQAKPPAPTASPASGPPPSPAWCREGKRRAVHPHRKTAPDNKTAGRCGLPNVRLPKQKP